MWIPAMLALTHLSRCLVFALDLIQAELTIPLDLPSSDLPVLPGTILRDWNYYKLENGQTVHGIGSYNGIGHVSKINYDRGVLNKGETTDQKKPYTHDNNMEKYTIKTMIHSNNIAKHFHNRKTASEPLTETKILLPLVNKSQISANLNKIRRLSILSHMTLNKYDSCPYHQVLPAQLKASEFGALINSIIFAYFLLYPTSKRHMRLGSAPQKDMILLYLLMMFTATHLKPVGSSPVGIVAESIDVNVRPRSPGGNINDAIIMVSEEAAVTASGNGTVLNLGF